MIDQEIALVELADMYLYVGRDDHAFCYLLEDARARELDLEEFPPLWRPSEVDYRAAWPLKGIGHFSIASMHLWKHNVPFEYFDIGANIGQTTIAQAIFYKRCGKTNRVHAFEPGTVFDLLCRSVRANRVGDVVSCINAAASDSSGEVEFHLTPKQSPAGSMIKAAVSRPEVKEVKTIVAQTVPLDDYVRNLRPGVGAIVKIDTEGADFKVLAGMKEMLATRPVVAQIEFFPKIIDYVDAAEELQKLAETFLLIDTGMGVSVKAADVGALMERISLLPMPMTDIFLISKTVPSYEALYQRILAE